MNKSIFFATCLFLAFSTSLFGQPLLTNFKHWKTTKYSTVTAAPWRTTNDVIPGLDWSLPSGVKASPNGFVTIKDNPTATIPCRNLEQIRVTWKDLEPIEGTYNWDLLRNAIKGSITKGYSGSVVRVWASVWDVLNYPDPLNPNTKWPIGTQSAPRWLRNGTNNVPLIVMDPSGDPGWQITNCDIMDSVYHAKYIRFIRALGASGIPAMPELAICYVTYRSKSMGEEITSYKDGESTATMAQIEQRTKARMDVWVEAFGVNKRKLMYVGEDEYAGFVGIGTRGGIVENYYQLVEAPGIGQYIDANRYLTVDENNPFIKNGTPFGDENEEYTEVDDKYGKVEAIGYRYMMSTLMMLKMRRNFAMLAKDTPNPELLYWSGLEYGRTVADAPDAWCWLNQSYVLWGVSLKGNVKNVERWLIQRDAPGYETEPYFQVFNNQWYADKNQPYDYVCRRGLKMGFALDDRLISEAPHNLAVKITYYDGIAGTLKLVYNDGNTIQNVSCTSTGTDAFITATFFINAVCKAKGTAFDFEIHSPERVPLNFVRVIPLEKITGVVSNKERDNFAVYPNPVSDILNIKHEINSQIKIYNIQGVLLHSQNTIGNNTSIDVTKFNSSNLLLVHLISTSGIRVVKVAKL